MVAPSVEKVIPVQLREVCVSGHILIATLYVNLNMYVTFLLGFKGVLTPVGVDVVFQLYHNRTVSGVMFSTGQFNFSDGTKLMGSFLLTFDDNYLSGIGKRYFTDGRVTDEYWNNGRLLAKREEIEKVNIYFFQIHELWRS